MALNADAETGSDGRLLDGASTAPVATAQARGEGGGDGSLCSPASGDAGKEEATGDWDMAAPEQAYDMSLPTEDDGKTGISSPLMQSRRENQSDRMHLPRRAGGGLFGGGGGGNRRGAQEFGTRSNAPQDVREHVKNVIEQNKELMQPFVVRNLTLTYFVTVVVVILLSVGGQVAVNIYIDKDFADAVVVKVSGEQTTYSQILAKDALALMYHALLNDNASRYVEEMKATSQKWHEIFAGLVNGSDAYGLPGTSNREVLREYETLGGPFEKISSAVNNILGLASLYNLTHNSSDFELLKGQLDVIVENEGTFWKTQDKITIAFEEQANNNLEFLLILSWLLVALIVLTLLLEGLLVFWPVTRHIQTLIDERFSLIRRSLEAEAENRGVSILMMGYISHELQQPLQGLVEHLDAAKDFLHTLENASMHGGVGPIAASSTAGLGSKGTGPSPAGLVGGSGILVQLPHQQGSAEDEQDGKTAPGSEGMLVSAVKGAMGHVSKARMCAELLGTVAGDIVNLRNIELGRMTLMVELVDVADVVHQVLSALAPKVPEGVWLRVDLDPALESDHHRLDRHRLQQVLLNLVDNALRFMTEGEVVVRGRPGKAPNMLRFEVEDTSGGMTEEQQQAMLEPVMDPESSNTVNEETGNLALYVVKLLVELQHGTYGVETEEGRGSIHWVELPAAGDGAPSQMQPSTKETAELTAIDIKGGSSAETS